MILYQHFLTESITRFRTAINDKKTKIYRKNAFFSPFLRRYIFSFKVKCQTTRILRHSIFLSIHIVVPLHLPNFFHLPLHTIILPWDKQGNYIKSECPRDSKPVYNTFTGFDFLYMIISWRIFIQDYSFLP